MSATSSAARGRLLRKPRTIAPAQLITRGAPTPAELVGYGVILAVATFLLLFEHIVKGGFYSDDWAYRTFWIGQSHGSFWTGLSSLYHSGSLRGRPTLSLYLSLLEQAFGSHQERYLAWTAVLAVLFSGSVYVLLRTLRLRPLDAGLIGLLVLVFPASDSTRAWSIISDAQVAMSLVLLGVACSIASLSARGRRAMALRVGGLLLVVLGVTTYELTFAALLLAFLFYRTRAPWRRVLREAALDWIVLILVYVLITSHSTAQHLSTSQTLSHGATVAGQAVTLLARTAMPFGSTAAGVAAGALIVVAALGVWKLLPAGDPVREDLRRWLTVIAIGIVMLGAAYVIYAPSALFYAPLEPGLLNRTNAFGAVPMIVIVYGLAALLGLLVFRGLRRSRGWSAMATSALVVGIGIGYTIAITYDLRLWDSGYHRAQLTLSAFHHEVAPPARESLIVFFGQPIEEAPQIPVWEHTWDLNGAIELAYHDLTLRGRPAFPGTKIVCGAHAAQLTNTTYTGVTLPNDNAQYGYLYLFNSITDAVGRPFTRRQCEREAPQFVPGPLLAPNPGGR